MYRLTNGLRMHDLSRRSVDALIAIAYTRLRFDAAERASVKSAGEEKRGENTQRRVCVFGWRNVKEEVKEGWQQQQQG